MRLVARVELRFESASVAETGQDLRRLAEAARAVGFDVVRADVRPAEEDDRGREWTGYGPLDEPPGS